MDWIIAGFNSGLSMILLSIIFNNTKKHFAKNTNVLLYFLMSLLPISLIIIGFIVSIFMKFESFAESYLLTNHLIILLGVPLMLFCNWRLLKKL